MKDMVILFCATKRTKPSHHYHDESYHKRFEPIDPGTAYWDEFSPTAFYVDVGKRSALAEPGSAISGVEINRAIGCSRAESMGSIP